MKIEEAIEKYYSKESLAKNICKYQLYYQIGLGNIVLESTQDLEETVQKIKELKLDVSSQMVITAIYDIIVEMCEQDDFEEVFDKQLRNLAFIQVLSDFVKADKELLNPKPFVQMIVDRIKEDKFFNYNMQEQFDVDLKVMLPSMMFNITEELSCEIKANMLEVYRLDQQ